MERAYLALKAANQGVWDWDLIKNQVYVSARYMTMLGYQEKASVMTPAEWGQMMHPKDAPKAWRAALNHMEGLTPSYEAEIRHRTTDGGWLWMLDRGKVVTRDFHGRPLRMVGTMADITLRKMTEKSLEKSEERWRQLFDKTNDAIFVQSINSDGNPGHFTEVNEVACRMLGYSKEELLAMPAEQIKKQIGLMTMWPGEEGPFRQGQVEVKAKNRTRLRLEIKSHAFTLQGRLTCLSIARDITWRHQAESALRESQERFLAAFKAQPDALVITTLKSGRLIEANDHFYRLTGLEPAEALGRTTVELGIWQDKEKRQELIKNISHQGRSDNLYISFKNRGGSTKHVLISTRALSTEGNRYLLSILRDITEEVGLTAFQKVILDAADAMEVGIGVLQDRGARKNSLIYANKALVDMLGLEQGSLLERVTLKDFTAPEDQKKLEGFFLAPKTSQEALPVLQCRLLRKDDKPLLARVVSAQTELEGKPALVLFCQDISEEQRLAKSLEHAQRMESIGTLASGIAHDFNNLLTIIMGFTQVSVNELKQGRQPLEDLNEVLAACERARDLIKQMLTFGRVREGDRRLMNLETLLKSFLKFIRAPVPVNIEIRHRILEKQALVVADPTQMQQILLNLCTNAAQAMEPGPGLLEITLSKRQLEAKDLHAFPNLRKGSYIELKVKDNGKGMKPKVAERVFEPFFTTKPRGQGTGLGLSVVHGIVTSHGGSITVKSSPQKGTEFTVLLPAAHADSLENVKSQKALPLPKGREHIILVDNEPQVAAAISGNLEELGYKVAVFNHSHEALDFFSKNKEKFALAILDFTMPKMSGPEMAEQILKLKKDLPVILCTGYGREVIKDTPLPKGRVSWLNKPFSQTELALTIQKILHSENDPQKEPA
jgi:PAS domain S-box-containing protein